MARPGVYNIVVDRNVTTDIDFNLKDSAGAAFDLTSYTVTADAVGSDLPGGVLELSPTITDALNGVINITLSKATTGALISTETSAPNALPKWDLLIDLTGVTTKVLTGTFQVVETVTT